MTYKEILNEIYFNYKKNDKYSVNENIKFYKESNTNIVIFKMNDRIKGIINDQNHLILIYFFNKSEFVYSETYILQGNKAIIYNYILCDGTKEKEETIEVSFNKREEIFKFCNSENKKDKQKRLKI